DYIEMEMQIPRSSIVKFIATCSYSRLNDFKTSRKNDPKLLQTLISTSSSLGTTRDTLGTTPEGCVLLGPERPRTYDDLNDNDKK
ncbi:hypothetical protein Tco_1349765, partial [Tanacetum coccineum]